MPLYEFRCARCSQQFEELIFGDRETPPCPTCAVPDRVSRVLSTGAKRANRDAGTKVTRIIKGSRPG